MRSPSRLALIALLYLAAIGPASLFAAGEGEGEDDATRNAAVDYLGVAAVMIRDGNYERAQSALEQVDLQDEETDLERFYTLAGLVALRLGAPAVAIENFELALQQGQTDSTLYVYLAQAYYTENRYQDAVDAINQVPNLNQFPALYGVLAESYWRLEQRETAYATLERAVQLFPSQSQLLRQQIFYLVELNLTQEAAEKGLLYLERLEDSPAAYVTVGEALRRGGNPDQAARTLEEGRLRHAGDEQIQLALAQAYIDLGYLRAAGSIIETAAARNQALYFEAAELFRRAGEYERALYLNSLVLEEGPKSLQRFNILLSQERYEESIAQEQRLLRSGELEADSTRYAMAFALFQTRQFDRAIFYLNQISDPEIFNQAVQLRRAIETVRIAG